MFATKKAGGKKFPACNSFTLSVFSLFSPLLLSSLPVLQIQQLPFIQIRLDFLLTKGVKKEIDNFYVMTQSAIQPFFTSL